jgi:hypothetical protein
MSYNFSLILVLVILVLVLIESLIVVGQDKGKVKITE